MKKETIEALKTVLASSYTLYLKTQNFHWNVEGPMFHSLHTMFEEHYTELTMAIDEIAERIRALGDYAPGSYKDFAKLSSLDDAPEGNMNAEQMVKMLVSDHEKVMEDLKALLFAAEKESDDVSVDLATVRLSVHEKTAWMLRSVIR